MKTKSAFLKKLPKQILQYALLLFGAFCALVPIVSCVTTAFKNDEEYRTTSVMTLPENWLYFENFKIAWEKAGMGRAFLNSFVILVSVLVGSTMISAMLAYVLNRFQFRVVHRQCQFTLFSICCAKVECQEFWLSFLLRIDVQILEERSR